MQQPAALLQPLAAAPTRPVLRRPLLYRAQAEPTADVVAVVDSKHSMTATLEVYFRPLPPPATAPATDSFVSATATLLPQLQVQTSLDESSFEERTPDYVVKRTLADLKKLRTDIKLCMGKGEHCHMCNKIATYLTYCWERPRMLNRAWNGAMSFQLDVLAKFMNQLLQYASQIGVDGPEACECHAKFGAIVSTFLQQDADKDL